ncbi:hypothetical protein N7541_003689 [Penicillium brevicompactum]|uniref:Erythromycin biosynthesis protein CIII-like C-terminal domain-containing protein n=1 Tax=Penicillium brevicompactum TaxID=5074 RepID=A0A9W9V1B5_PENBR|nr:hypothetical protein N7541_003689 [Penicillium brevicompactum]
METQTVLILTNSEPGQSNVQLAVAHEMLLRSGYDIHIASFPILEEKIKELNAYAGECATNSETATFHALEGPTCVEAVRQNFTHDSFMGVKPGYGVRAAVNVYSNQLSLIVSMWNSEDYLTVYDSCIKVIDEVKPDLIVVDLLLQPAIDACSVGKVNHCFLGPNTLLEHIPTLRLTKPWKYPQLNSGFPFPLPWSQVLPNIYLAFRLILSLVTSRRLKDVSEARNAHGIPGRYPPATTSVPSIITSLPETDLPCKISANITCCGPILRPCKPIEEQDSGLALWLAQRPTVLVNLGSGLIWDTQRTIQFAEGIRVLLQRRQWIQVLWKLQSSSVMGSVECDDDALSGIRENIDSGQVKIMDWLPDPISILQSGNILCMVHHGGSNSFHEAIQAGVPHVVLPVWFDTYDFATRAEWLGIGVWGNKSAAPHIDGAELGDALVRVIASDESVNMFLKAQEIMGNLGEGRVIACEKIIELLEASRNEQQESDQ